MIHQTFDKFVCQGDTIVTIGSTAWRNNATGKVAESPKVDVWRVRDGKIRLLDAVNGIEGNCW